MAEPTFGRALEFGPDAIACFDRDGRLLYVSPSIEHVLGYAPDELASYDMQELVHPDDRRRVQDEFSGLAERPGDTIPLEVRVRHRDGSWRWLEGAGANLLSVPVAPTIVVTFRDSTERRGAETTVRTARARLAAILQHLTDGFVVQNAAGQLLFANDAAARLFGYASAGSLIATAPAELFRDLTVADEAGRDLSPDMLPGPRILRGEEVPSLTLAVQAVAGGPRWVSITATLVDDVLTQSRFALSVLHDVTEQREVEQELRHSIELRDTFLAAASHELRTPLTSLKGFLELCQRRLQRQGSLESIGEALEVASRQANLLTRLVGGLLDVSRLARGLFVIEPAPLELVPLVRRVVATERTLEQPPRTIQLVAPEPGPRLLADADRLEQVLANLLQNARRYGPAERPITVTVAATPAGVSIAVHDEGSGIPAEDLPHLFEAFHRGSNADKGLTSFGLGLYVAREIVQAHGGSLTVASTPATGSTFMVTLPTSTQATGAIVRDPDGEAS